MTWISLKILASEQDAEMLSDALMDIGALSTSIEDAEAETPNEQAIFGEPGDPPPGVWQQNIVSGLFSDNADIQDILSKLSKHTGLPSFNYSTETIQEQDWVRTTQAQFNPIQISDKLYIVPTWHESPDQNAINIALDPGLAFGTGSHPTTHLCLEWLCQQPNLGTVLDYGCGSGILAIAAKKLGAAAVTGVDIDPQAILASRANAQQNDVNIDFFDADSFSHLSFDFVVANILSSALMVLAPALASYCKTGGKIALSGILKVQSDTLIARYNEWFIMDAPTQNDAWILLTGTKR